eukprot:COSAG01_NODE_60709_length_293_cov_0.809278_1_plen_91_part_10
MMTTTRQFAACALLAQLSAHANVASAQPPPQNQNLTLSLITSWGACGSVPFPGPGSPTPGALPFPLPKIFAIQGGRWQRWFSVALQRWRTK